MNKLTLFIIVFTILIFTGCVDRASIEPNYNNKTKELTVLNKVFSNARKIDFDKNIPLDAKTYSLNDKNCKDFLYLTFDSDFDTEVLIKLNFLIEKDVWCEVTKSSNTKFIHCKEEKEDLFFITKAIPMPDYEMIEIIGLDQKCYNYLKKDYLKEKKSKTYIIN